MELDFISSKCGWNLEGWQEQWGEKITGKSFFTASLTLHGRFSLCVCVCAWSKEKIVDPGASSRWFPSFDPWIHPEGKGLNESGKTHTINHSDSIHRQQQEHHWTFPRWDLSHFLLHSPSFDLSWKQDKKGYQIQKNILVPDNKRTCHCDDDMMAWIVGRAYRKKDFCSQTIKHNIV